MPVAGETSLARIQSAPLRRELRPGVGDEVVGLGGEADDQRRAAVPRWRDRREDVGVLGEGERRRLAGAVLLDLAGARLPTRQSATAAAMTATSAGSAASHRRQHLARRLDMDDGDARRIGQRRPGRSPGHARRRRAAAAAAMAWPCLPEERLAR